MRAKFLIWTRLRMTSISFFFCITLAISDKINQAVKEI